MIALLRGVLHEKHPNQAIVLCQGVGYDVQISVTTFGALPAAGAEVALRIHTHVREDALVLYGFATAEEKALFEKLITVSGVGPRLAVTILSGVPAMELAGILRAGDAAQLTRIPGIGKKTAERLVLELRDKLPTALPAAKSAAPHAPDVLNALLALGYNSREAAAATRDLPADLALADAIRQALKVLAKP